MTDDDADVHARGCDAITIADSSRASVVATGPRIVSPGQLAATSDGKLIAALATNDQAFVHVLQWRPGTREWEGVQFDDAQHLGSARGGAIAISPDDTTMLVAWDNAVAKYWVSNITSDGLGPVAGSTSFSSDTGPVVVSTVASAIEFSADSRTAYVVANDGLAYRLDVPNMDWDGAAIPYVATSPRQGFRTRRTFASLSPDERWLVINTADQQGGRLNVLDLRNGSTELVTAPGLRESWGVEFNYTPRNRGLLAVHGGRHVAVYRMTDSGFQLLVSEAVLPPADAPAPWPRELSRIGALAWSGDGGHLIVNIGVSAREWRVLSLSRGARWELGNAADFDSCMRRPSRHLGFDVVTLQDRLHRPTLTTTPAPSETPTGTPTPTALTPEPTASPSATRTASLSPTRTPTATALSAPLHLPLVLSERCQLEHQRADVAIVLDTSSSMSGQRLGGAKAAALLFVSMIDLAPGRSQVALVRYDREVAVVRELTRSRALIEAAIRSLQVRSGTHIDKGLRAALGELRSPRHLDRNLPVMILLTDGLQTGTPGEELKAAKEVRDAGVRLYAIGLGSDVDEEALKTMAGDDSRYYYAPDSADLARLCGEIAQDLMCPGKEFWGGR